jgi:hypothetical protein
MKSKFRMGGFWLVLGTICLCSAPRLWAQSANVPASASGSNQQPGLTGASAGCGYSIGEAPTAPSRPQQKSDQAEGMSRRPALLLISGHNDQHSDDDSDRGAIVGLWKFKFVSKGSSGIPDGTVIDDGYVTWHSDGTEIMNSGRPPITSNFCMGVWQQTKGGTYKLNHFALSWNSDGTIFIGPANIREEVVLDRSGNNYTGIFTIDQFDTNEHVVAHISGTVTAQRITAD